MKRRTYNRLIRITIRVETAKISKVKAYKRFRNGKIEKVRSYYRRY